MSEIRFFDYLDIINCDLIVRRYNNQKSRWSAYIEDAEIKENAESCILSGTYGNGLNPEVAINDYINQIRGKLLVIHSTSKTLRKEYTIPITIKY